jgi:hypothetical protein
MAEATGLKKYLVSDQIVLTEDEFDALSVEYINSDQTTRDGKLKKREYIMEKKKRDNWSKAKRMMVNSIVSRTMFKRIGLCDTPNEMFELICRKYGRQKGSDLDGLIKEIQTIKLRSMKPDPEDFFTKIDD